MKGRGWKAEMLCGKYLRQLDCRREAPRSAVETMKRGPDAFPRGNEALSGAALLLNVAGGEGGPERSKIAIYLL